MSHDSLHQNLTLFECVGFTVDDPFDDTEQPMRNESIIWACDEQDAYDIGFDLLVAGSSTATVLNWFVRELPPDHVMRLADLEREGQLHLDLTQVH